MQITVGGSKLDLKKTHLMGLLLVIHGFLQQTGILEGTALFDQGDAAAQAEMLLGGGMSATRAAITKLTAEVQALRVDLAQMRPKPQEPRIDA